MNDLIKKTIEKIRIFIPHIYNLLRNNNKDFTVISNDCWGAEIYKDTNLPYLTPFVGLMIMAPCYIKLLQNLELLKTEPLKFTENSKYPLNISKKYPIGLIKDIEIHFLHYADEAEAASKWERRVKRMNWDNLFIKFDGSKDFATPELVKKFDELPYKNKICLVNEKEAHLNSVIKISEWNPDGKLMYRFCQKEFDVINWINNKDTKPNFLQKLFYFLFIRPL
ncbi:MAG: hypothetical protein KatS3mg002_1553 [Candidatus Woesearchaeota archaeon]|nr:MAG: hypothetical protein KatS3mg002_1553 [Candidatus Woesearchaeota archaeon]